MENRIPTKAEIAEQERIQRRNLFLACSASAVGGFALAVLLSKNPDRAEYLRNLRNELREVEYDNWVRMQFIDTKRLQDEYTKFAKEWNKYR